MTPTPTRRALHEGWALTPVSGPVPAAIPTEAVPATVPGAVHTDLLSAGLIPDPLVEENERLVAWISRCDWEYRTRFSWEPDGHERHDLVFDGLDTVATVRLNGEVIAETANQHRTYRLAVDGALVAGDNELVIRFTSPVRYADEQSLALGPRQHLNAHPYNAIRKSACTFGWDWGPDLPSTGIWRPVSLHSWSGVRLAQVRPLATVTGDLGQVKVHVELERAGASGPVEVDVAVGQHGAQVTVPAEVSSAVVNLRVPDVQRWWPRGYGDPVLYPITVRAGADAWSSRIGFRTVRIDQTPDEEGASFTFVINDQPISVRGANWIPDDVFVHRVDRQRYEARIRQAAEANMTMLRVWGGGIYEADDFYDLCDEYGILTWQDFLFACAAYSEEEPLRSEVEAEARENIARLLPHPSLVLWAGNNECVVGRHHWGWRETLDGQTWGKAYYTELLPGLLSELDPQRPYVPASPWSGSVEADPHDHGYGVSHLWTPWNKRPYSDYRASIPRFVAEFGWQAPPTWPTLVDAISDDPLTPESPGMLTHQKAWKGNDKLTAGLLPHFPLPTTMEDWHWAMSLNQAIAVRTGLEHFRSWSSRCGGALVWQLNDCWPVTSWALIDGGGRPKPAYFALTRAFADRLLTIQPRPAGLAVVAVNDSADDWSGTLILERRSFTGAVLAATAVEVDVGGRSSVTIGIDADVATAVDSAAEVVLASLGDQRAEWFFAEYRHSALAAPELDAVVSAVDGGYEIEVKAGNLVRDVSILAERVHPDARVDDMLVTIFPGDHVRFRVSAPARVAADDFAAPTVLRSANELLARRGRTT